MQFLILLTLFGTLKKKDKPLEKFGKIIATIAGTTLIIFILVISIFTDMCNWYDDKIIYENKNGNQKIIIRKYGCGSTDSGPPATEVHHVKYYSTLFISYVEIDTNSIDKTDWLEVKQ